MRSYEHLSLLPKVLDTHLCLYGLKKISAETCLSLRNLTRRLDGLSDDEFLRIGGYRRLHTAIGVASGEAAVNLLHWATTEAVIDLMSFDATIAAEARRGEHWRLTLKMVEALIAGDAGALMEGRRLQQGMFKARWSDWEPGKREPDMSPRFDDPGGSAFLSVNSQAERLAREILREIRRQDWKAGERIGGGAELMQRYGASGHIVRQAVRMLEEHSAVRMERGRKGGLYIGAPDVERAVERAVEFLKRTRADPKDVTALIEHLLLEVLNQSSPTDLSRIGAELIRVAEHAHPQDAMSLGLLFQSISKRSENPAAMLGIEVLSSAIPHKVVGTQPFKCLGEALCLGDVAWSRRRFLQCVREDPAP